MHLGIIAEHPSDIAVMRALTSKIVGAERLGIKQFASYGCAKLRRKCEAWAGDLVRRGCSCVVVVHDLDGRDEASLRRGLEACLRPVTCNASIVLIPTQEIEAWLMTDAEALRKVFGLKRQPRLPYDTERLRRPKEFLRDLVWREARQRYISTIHNARIAAASSVSTISRCRSFRAYPRMIRALMG